MFDPLLSLAIRLATAAVVLGWLLSSLGALSFRGYLLAGIPVVVVIAFFSCRNTGAPARPFLRRLVRRRRRRRLLPGIFWLTFLLIVAGSVLHEPNNFDGLSYRIPKVLGWLNHGGWCWIDTPYEPINYTLPNYEWLTVPWFLGAGGFHGTVVINWIAFLLLPSLCFSLMRTCGASGRAAYDWMWIFPSSYLVVMLAGGIGNDLVGMTAILAALHCARRFVTAARGSFLLDALLAAGFCTGVKVSNLPLAVFVLLVLLTNHRLLRAHFRTLAFGAVLAALASALIPLALNFRHTGSVLGTSPDWQVDRVEHPVAGLLGNGLILLTSGLAAPVFPGAHQITGLLERGLGDGLLSWLKTNYVKFSLKLNELPQEEGGGLGLGITLAVILFLVLSWRARRVGNAHAFRSLLLPWQWCAWWAWSAFALLVLCAKLGTGSALPRNLLPWFPLLLLPLVALAGRSEMTRLRTWRAFAPVVSLSVLPALFLTPSRPLIPLPLILKAAQAAHLPTAARERLEVVYDVYARRADPFAALRREWPPEVRVVGLISGGGEPTAAWWKPYGSHQCVYLLSEAAVRAARQGGVQYVVIHEPGCQKYFGVDTARWLIDHQARAIKTVEIRVFAADPPSRYTLATLGIPPASQSARP